jgi:hypothetical protein
MTFCFRTLQVAPGVIFVAADEYVGKSAKKRNAISIISMVLFKTTFLNTPDFIGKY